MSIKKLKNEKGFTLVEMIVLIVMIGILSTLMVPSVLQFIDKAHKNRNYGIAVSVAKSAEMVGIDLRTKNSPAAPRRIEAEDSDRDGLMSFSGASEYEIELNKFMDGEKFDKGSKLIIITTASNVLHRVIYVKNSSVEVTSFDPFIVTRSANRGVYPDYEWIQWR